MRDLLAQLRGQYKLTLLSNIDPYYWPTVKASIPELAAFDAKVLSFEHGVAKPESGAYQLAVSASGCIAERCLFIDDKRENVDAAAFVGLAGHAFTSCRRLKVALRQAGIRVS